MIKAIIFDVGGVLIRTHDHGPRRRWEQKLGIGEWESEYLVFSGADGTAAQQGAISDDELWSRIAHQMNLEAAQLEQFRHDFWAGDVLDDRLVDLIRRLRPTYQTAIISNATDNLRRLLDEEHSIADAFDLIVCSAEERVLKPDHEIYERTLSRLGREPHEAVFVDDSQDNVTAARSLGMHAIHYHEGLDLQATLSRLGIELSGDNESLAGRTESKGEQSNV